MSDAPKDKKKEEPKGAEPEKEGGGAGKKKLTGKVDVALIQSLVRKGCGQ